MLNLPGPGPSGATMYLRDIERGDLKAQRGEEQHRYANEMFLRQLDETRRKADQDFQHKIALAEKTGQAAGVTGQRGRIPVEPEFRQVYEAAEVGGQAQTEMAKRKAEAEKQKALAVERERQERARIGAEARRDVAGIRGKTAVETTGMKEEGATGRTAMTTESRERIAGMNIASALERQARDQLFQWEDRQDAETFKYNLEMELADKQMQRLMQSFRNNKKLAALRGKSDAVNNVMRSMTAVVGKGMGSLLPQSVAEAKRLLPVLKGTQAVYLRAGGDMNPEKSAQAVFEYLESTDYAAGIEGGGGEISPILDEALNAPAADLQGVLQKYIPGAQVNIPGWDNMDRNSKLAALEQAGVLGEE